MRVEGDHLPHLLLTQPLLRLHARGEETPALRRGVQREEDTIAAALKRRSSRTEDGMRGTGREVREPPRLRWGCGDPLQGSGGVQADWKAPSVMAYTRCICSSAR